MTNVASAPAGVHVRPLYDLFRPTRRDSALESPTFSTQASLWETVSLVLNQQLGHDAMLLWRHDLRRERLHLLTSAPGGPCHNDLIVQATEHLSQLANRRLEAVAHVHCALSECPAEQALWELGLHSGLTTHLAEEGDDVYLVTFGFRQRWQLVAHHAATVTAVMAYLQECQRTALPALSEKRWWELLAQVPHLWRQPYRPSVMRTIYDLNETLADVADRARPEAAVDPLRLRQRLSRLAHKAADLMARLESVYLDTRPTVSTEEYLSEALLLVRGAYQLGLGDWPGCVAAMSAPPPGDATNANAIRHHLVDWVLEQVQAEAVLEELVAG